jgi:hypothetical protein
LIQLDATCGIDGSDYMELIINIYVHRYNNYYLVKLLKNKRLQWTHPIFILASATIEARVQNDGTDASLFSVATHQ